MEMNAIFFQVRPANDAFYPSQYNPWSDYLAGYGVDPGWDPLAWMIEVTHAEGIEFHAWLNPYRTSVTSYSVKYDTALSAGTINTVKTEVQDYKRSYASERRSMAGNGYNNPFLDPVDASFQQKVLMGAEGRMVLNPAHEATLTHLANTISEIITNYEVDGIHFDDYFYPAAEKYDGYPVEPWADDADYENTWQKAAHYPNRIGVATMSTEWWKWFRIWSKNTIKNRVPIGLRSVSALPICGLRIQRIVHRPGFRRYGRCSLLGLLDLQPIVCGYEKMGRRRMD